MRQTSLMKAAESTTGTITARRLEGTIPASRVNADNTTHSISVAWPREFAVHVVPVVEEVAHCFAQLVFAAARMVAAAGDGVDGAHGEDLFVGAERFAEIFDGFFNMKAFLGVSFTRGESMRQGVYTV
jgi:hypothetical protein